jgi:hypothetical protein
LARAAAPRDFIISALLQIIGGGGIALLLLLGQQCLQAILNAWHWLARSSVRPSW